MSEYLTNWHPGRARGPQSPNSRPFDGQASLTTVGAHGRRNDASFPAVTIQSGSSRSPGSVMSTSHLDDLVESSAEQLESASRLLGNSSEYRVLRRLQPRPVDAAYQPGPSEKIAVLVDVETTGLDRHRDEVIEIGMVAFVHDTEGQVGPVVGVLGMLHEPRSEISAEITKLTGITTEMVLGQTIDLSAVRSLVESAELIIAHNARFDRVFCERLDPSFAYSAWACSMAEVPWRQIGFEDAKLGHLVKQCGWFHCGHRAVDDCQALLAVLAHDPGNGTGPVLGHLLRSAARTRVRLWAEWAPFHMKDVLKTRGYQWSAGGDGRLRAWWTEVDENDVVAELRFLEREIYRREIDIYHEKLTAYERYRS